TWSDLDFLDSVTHVTETRKSRSDPVSPFSVFRHPTSTVFHLSGNLERIPRDRHGPQPHESGRIPRASPVEHPARATQYGGASKEDVPSMVARRGSQFVRRALLALLMLA